MLNVGSKYTEEENMKKNVSVEHLELFKMLSLGKILDGQLSTCHSLFESCGVGLQLP